MVEFCETATLLYVRFVRCNRATFELTGTDVKCRNVWSYFSSVIIIYIYVVITWVALDLA